jgi:hypothetical protein
VRLVEQVVQAINPPAMAVQVAQVLLPPQATTGQQGRYQT